MRKIIIDTDPGIDDALAILLALSAKDELDVVALTTVNGNVGIEQVTKNAFKILDVAEETTIPVYQGYGKPLMRENDHCMEFHGDDGLGNTHIKDSIRKPENENAVDFLIRKVREEKNEITLVPIGPLTNIAAAIQKDPEFVNNVKEVVIMGGAEKDGNMSPHAEFNFWVDPEAAKIVFQAGFKKVTLVTLDATSYAFLTPQLRELMYMMNTRISKFMYDVTRVYLDASWNSRKILGCRLCDVLTIAYLLNPDIAKTEDAFVDVETKGLCEGASIIYRTEKYKNKIKNCDVIVEASTNKFFKVFFGYLFPESIPFVENYLN